MKLRYFFPLIFVITCLATLALSIWSLFLLYALGWPWIDLFFGPNGHTIQEIIVSLLINIILLGFIGYILDIFISKFGKTILLRIVFYGGALVLLIVSTFVLLNR